MRESREADPIIAIVDDDASAGKGLQALLCTLAVGDGARLTAPINTDASLDELARQAIVEAFQRTHGHKSRAAALLDLTRFQLYTCLKRYQIAVMPGEPRGSTPRSYRTPACPGTSDSQEEDVPCSADASF
jgi:hypothetical protein